MCFKLLPYRLVLFLLIGFLPSNAFGARRTAASKTIKVVLLPIKAQGFTGQMKKELRNTISKELQDIGVFKQVPTRFMLRKLQQLARKKIYRNGCMSNPVCIRTVGGVFKARVILHLESQHVSQGLILRMRSYDAKSGKIIRQIEEKTDQGSAELAKVARWLTRKVSSPMITTLARGKGRFVVSCNEKDATLVVNGKSFGERVGKSFKVSSGVFDIVVNKPGFTSYRDVLVVKPGGLEAITAIIRPEQAMFPAISRPQETKPPAESSAIPPLNKTLDKERKEAEKKEPAVSLRKKPDQEKDKAPPWAVTDSAKKPQPFLPSTQKQPVPLSDERVEKEKFYETWWFWTVVGVVVVGGGGFATYQLTKDDGVSGGSAIVTWP